MNSKNKTKLFFCSDIHGGYTPLVRALLSAGFDENNINHKLIVLGDIFDRLDENVEVYEYLKQLTDNNRAIVITGNHHKFLIDFLEGSINPFNYLHNGLDTTLGDFWHRTKPFESWCLIDKQCNINTGSYAEWAEACRNDINREYPELLPWLKSLPRYFESEHYIGVHGAIDTTAPDWHEPHCSRYNLRGWDALEFDDGSFFGSEIKNTNKTVIIGHFGASHLREMYGIEDSGGYDILKREDGKVIAIDATTVISHKVNVLVIEDNLLEE